MIVVTAHSDLDNAVAAYQGGAFEYLPKPFDVDEAVRLVEKAARQRGLKAGEPSGSGKDIPALIGQAPASELSAIMIQGFPVSRSTATKWFRRS